MARWMIVGALAALSWVACGGDAASSDDDDDGPSSGAGASGSAGSGTGATTGAGVTTGGGGGSTPIPTIEVCLAPCSTPADCAVPNAPAFDVDNYACDDGACRYLGCNTDAECMAQGDFVCRDQFGLSTCLVGCTTPSDCGVQTSPAYDADNYACDAGACIYTGCNSDAECQASVGSNYACRAMAGGVASCFPTCTTAADCDLGQPANDADNYACDDGLCIYQGCNSDAECMMQGNLVCR